jgi:hypothetical protein
MRALRRYMGAVDSVRPGRRRAAGTGSSRPSRTRACAPCRAKARTCRSGCWALQHLQRPTGRRPGPALRLRGPLRARLADGRDRLYRRHFKPSAALAQALCAWSVSGSARPTPTRRRLACSPPASSSSWPCGAAIPACCRRRSTISATWPRNRRLAGLDHTFRYSAIGSPETVKRKIHQVLDADRRRRADGRLADLRPRRAQAATRSWPRCAESSSRPSSPISSELARLERGAAGQAAIDRRRAGGTPRPSRAVRLGARRAARPRRQVAGEHRLDRLGEGGGPPRPSEGADLSSTDSATPPAATPITGRPQAMASSTIRPNGSLSLAWTKASQLASTPPGSAGSRT